MNELNAILDFELNRMAALKLDLQGVEDLLEERPFDPENIVATMEQRESQIDELKNILPTLNALDSEQIVKRCRSIENDKLFKAFITAIDQHNRDLDEFKQLSKNEIKDKKDLKTKADELTRIALKQSQLETVKRQLVGPIRKFRTDLK